VFRHPIDAHPRVVPAQAGTQARCHDVVTVKVR
ncbi:MAG: hypothetical protein RI925_1856, partial [Pseudomonadota bacterium]